eukprot:SAG31_NODE_442_length_15661_cov_4.132245_19_plen_50_part_00
MDPGEFQRACVALNEGTPEERARAEAMLIQMRQSPEVWPLLGVNTSRDI